MESWLGGGRGRKKCGLSVGLGASKGLVPARSRKGMACTATSLRLTVCSR